MVKHNSIPPPNHNVLMQKNVMQSCKVKDDSISLGYRLVKLFVGGGGLKLDEERNEHVTKNIMMTTMSYLSDCPLGTGL